MKYFLCIIDGIMSFFFFHLLMWWIPFKWLFIVDRDHHTCDKSCVVMVCSSSHVLLDLIY